MSYTPATSTVTWLLSSTGVFHECQNKRSMNAHFSNRCWLSQQLSSGCSYHRCHPWWPQQNVSTVLCSPTTGVRAMTSLRIPKTDDVCHNILDNRCVPCPTGAAAVPTEDINTGKQAVVSEVGARQDGNTPATNNRQLVAVAGNMALQDSLPCLPLIIMTS